MKKVGIIGLGNNSREFIKSIIQINTYSISGIFDSDKEKLIGTECLLNIPLFTQPFGLIAQSDLLLITKDNEYSYNIIIECIQQGKNVIIANPETFTVKEIEEINKLSLEASISVIPMLIYKYNNCLTNAKLYISRPQFVNINFASSMMNIDKKEILLNLACIALELAKSNIKKVVVNAVNIVSGDPSIFSIYFEFSNGCTAAIKADFMNSNDNLLISIYQYKCIIEADLTDKTIQLKNYTTNNSYEFEIIKPEFGNNETLFSELLEYLDSANSSPISVYHLDSYLESIKVLTSVMDKINQYSL